MRNIPSVATRKAVLNKLLKNLLLHEEEIHAALKKDFGKPKFEAVLTETAYVINDLKHTIKNLNSWAKPKKVFPSLLNFPSTDYIISEPYGKVLIIAPWNYPYQLAMCPLIAAIAAGNSVTLKPSELTPATSALISKIVRETFEIHQALVVTGDYTIAQDLLSKRWNYIFFTGSVPVGKIVAKAAAEHMTPVTLELGGKSPCVVDETANIPLAAKRIVWGKLVNAGQTCIAPDYLLVHYRIKQQLIKHIIQEIEKALGENPEISDDFARIVNKKNWLRQLSLLENTKIIHGGQHNEESFYLAPTLVDEPDLELPIMNEEIFGPILPIKSYENIDDIDRIISKFERPLSFYVFSTNKDFIEKMTLKFPFGGGCINDTLVHFANHNLPFGGVGHSGVGAYHGKYGFDSFSHKKAIVKKANWLDVPVRYAPYKGKLNILKRFLNWL